jgi:hypothetical protein
MHRPWLKYAFSLTTAILDVDGQFVQSRRAVRHAQNDAIDGNFGKSGANLIASRENFGRIVGDGAGLILIRHERLE